MSRGLRQPSQASPRFRPDSSSRVCSRGFCFDSGGFIGTGINGGGPLLGHVNLHWSGFELPALPPGAVITRIYPIITAERLRYHRVGKLSRLNSPGSA